MTRRVLVAAALGLALALGLGEAHAAEPWDRLVGAEASLARVLSRMDTVLACQDLIDRIAVAQGRLTVAAADARLKAVGQQLYRREVSDAEIADSRARLGTAIAGYLDLADRAVATSTSWPRPDSAAKARQLLPAVRASYPRWLQGGLDPVLLLSQVALAMGWARGEAEVANPFAGHLARMRGAYPEPRTRSRLAAAAGPLSAPDGKPVPVQPMAPPGPGPTGATGARAPVPPPGPPGPGPPPGASVTGPSLPTGGGAPAQPGEDEHALWRRVYAADTREGYELYLRQYPRGQYADIARAALGPSTGATPSVGPVVLPAAGPPPVGSIPTTPATPATMPVGPIPPTGAVTTTGPGSTTPGAPGAGISIESAPAGLTLAPTSPPPRGGTSAGRTPGESIGLGNTLLSQGQFPEALEAFNEALQTEPQALEALLGRGRSLNAIGDVDAAIPSYEAALRVDPGRPHVRAWIAELAIARNDLGRAETAIAEELRLFPSSAWAYSFLGTLRMLQGRQADGGQALATAMRLDPAVATQRHQNGAYLGGLGQHPRALTEFATVVLLDPTLAGAYYGMGVEAAQLGQTARAIQAYEAYLARDGGSEWARRARQEVARLRGQGLPNPSGFPAGVGTACPPGRVMVGDRCLVIQPR